MITPPNGTGGGGSWAPSIVIVALGGAGRAGDLLRRSRARRPTKSSERSARSRDEAIADSCCPRFVAFVYDRSNRGQRSARGALIRRFYPSCESVLAQVVLGIEPGIDVEPGAQAPMAELRRRAVRRDRARITDAIFISVRRDARRLPSARQTAGRKSFGSRRSLPRTDRHGLRGPRIERSRFVARSRPSPSQIGAATQSAVDKSKFLMAPLTSPASSLRRGPP